MARGIVNIGGGAPSIHTKELSDFTITFASIGVTTLTDVINYTGSGWIHSICVMPDDNELSYYVTCQILINGINKVNSEWGRSEQGDYLQGNRFTTPIHFSASIQILVKTSLANTSCKCVVAWTKDGLALPKVNKYLQGETKLARTTSTGLIDIINVTGSGEFRSLCVGSRNDLTDDIDVSIIIDGTTVYSNELGESRASGYQGWAGNIDMAIPFETSLQVTINGNGTQAEGRIQYMLDS